MSEDTTNVTPDVLQTATDASRLLVNAKVTIIAAYANGRRPVLIIDAPPPFVVGALKRQHPNGKGGTTVVMAASFNGCQLEWMRDIPGVAEVQAVGHG